MNLTDGIGGVFFKSPQPKTIREWYEKHLGISTPDGSACLPWIRPGTTENCFTVWSPFAHDTDYFGKSGQSFMINIRVKNLDAMLSILRANGADVEERTEDLPFGRFGWVNDLQGYRIELWQATDENVHFKSSLLEGAVSGMAEIKITADNPQAWLDWYARHFGFETGSGAVRIPQQLENGKVSELTITALPRPRVKSGIRQELLISYADPFLVSRVAAMRAAGIEIPAANSQSALFCDPDGTFLQLIG